METRYTDREMALILERAAELQAAGDEPTHTLETIQQIAQEVGIDRRLVADAAATLPARGADATASGLMGLPSALRLSRRIAGVLGAADHAEVIATIRDHMSRAGAVREFPGGVEWYAGPAGDKTVVTLSASPAGETTAVRVQGRYDDSKVGLYAGAGVATLVAGVIGVAAAGSPEIGLGVGVGALATSFAGARALWNRLVTRRRARMERLVEALAEQIGKP